MLILKRVFVSAVLLFGRKLMANGSLQELCTPKIMCISNNVLVISCYPITTIAINNKFQYTSNNG